MPAQLVALTDGPNILVDKPILLLGRHPECDILIDSRKISRRHCCIAQVDDFLVVRDLGSTNGIRINGVKVLEGKLKASDELTIGNSRYRVRYETAVEVRKHPRAAVRSRGDSLDDAMLESCDEPVPLEDVGAGPQAVKPAAPIPIFDVPDSLELPENLELAPLSDVVPPQK
jgi:predicted component of type VI protein secretion system